MRNNQSWGNKSYDVPNQRYYKESFRQRDGYEPPRQRGNFEQNRHYEFFRQPEVQEAPRQRENFEPNRYHENYCRANFRSHLVTVK